jgi:putative tricarboxylic transport membrane protein
MGVRRKESEVWGSLFWIAIGVFFAVGGIYLKPGALHNPGPGFLPLVMALLLILFSLFNLVRGLIKPKNPLTKIAWRRPAWVVASVFFYGLLLDLFGFLISTFILASILFGLLVTSKNKWPKVLLYSAATALVAWLVFSVALKVPFPSPRLITLWR